MKISENTSVSMPMKNMIGIVVAVAMGVFAYTEVTARLTSLETSRELFQADLLKKSEQKPTDQEQFMLIESLFGGPAHSRNEYLNEYGARCVTWNLELSKEMRIKITEDKALVIMKETIKILV